MPPSLHVVLVPQGSGLSLGSSSSIFSSGDGFSAPQVAHMAVAPDYAFVKPSVFLSQDGHDVLMSLMPKGHELFVTQGMTQNQESFGHALSRAYQEVAGRSDDGGLAPALFGRMLALPAGNLAAMQDASGAIYASLPYTMATVGEHLVEVLAMHLANDGIALMKSGVPYSVWATARAGAQVRDLGAVDSQSASGSFTSFTAGVEGLLPYFGTLGAAASFQRNFLNVFPGDLSTSHQRAVLSSWLAALYGRSGSRNQYGLADGQFGDFSLGYAWHTGHAQGDNLSADIRGHQLFFSSGSGYNFLLSERWGLYPFFRVTGQFVRLAGETLPSVNIHAKDEYGLSSVIGLGFQEALCLCGSSDDMQYPFFDVRVGWHHAWVLPNDEVRGTIRGTSQAFVLDPPRVPRSTLLTQAAVRFLFKQRGSASLVSTVRVGEHRYFDLGLGLELEFHW